MCKEFLKEITETPGLSGYEHLVAAVVEKYMSPYADDLRKDNLGSLVCLKKGHGDGTKKIMLCAHMDEVGLMVTKIDENGFLEFINIGGVDQRTLLVQEVVVHGSKNGGKDFFGVIGNKPPHILSISERSKSVKMKDMLIDIGMTKEEAEQWIMVGDTVTMKRDFREMQNETVTGKALDDRAGVAVLYECLKILKDLKHECDVYAVCSTQEEVGYRGAITSTFRIQPSIGIAIDVGFGTQPSISKDDAAELGGGPAIALGGNIHPKVYERIVKVAEELEIPIQDDITPGRSGTDAWGMQVTGCGVATGIVSIPLRYMHTSVETISLKDLRYAGRLLAHFILSLNEEKLEAMLCV